MPLISLKMCYSVWIVEKQNESMMYLLNEHNQEGRCLLSHARILDGLSHFEGVEGLRASI